MYIALDEFGSRINAENAEKQNAYYCPICKERLVLKNGMKNAKHFAHMAGNCTDSWNYDMSEWHKRMQGYFSEQYREVVVRQGNKIHRADILVNSTVIEFQHSPITAAEFADRNEFFKQCGYSVAWVFDVSDQYENKALSYVGYSDSHMAWKHPYRIFAEGSQLSDYLKNYAIWLYWDDDKKDIGNKVIWSAKNDEGNPSFSRIVVSCYELSFHPKMENDIKLFFYSKQDYLEDALNELRSTQQYKTKYIGERGKPREAYICPLRPSEFGLRNFGEGSCRYCRYCAFGAEKKRENQRKKMEFYCCYPNQVHEVDEAHPGYDCSGIPMYEL